MILISDECALYLILTSIHQKVTVLLKETRSSQFILAVKCLIVALLVIVGDLGLATLDAEVAAGEVRVGVGEAVLEEAEQADPAHSAAPHTIQLPLQLAGERAIVEEVVGGHVGPRVEVPCHHEAAALSDFG